jgi:hypothetical protein
VRPRLLAPLLLALLLPAPARAFVYWVNPGAGTIARANLNGGHLRVEFVRGAWFPCGVAVAGGHIYWGNRRGPVGGRGTTIGRASLDGSHVENRFIRGAHGPCWIAVTHSHIYWANDNGTIGRARLDGTHVRPRFIDVSDQGSESNGIVPYISGLAIAGGHLYWSDWANGTIGDASLDGSGADDAIIALPLGSGPQGIAISRGILYWASASGDIGRTTLDGSAIDPSFAATGSPGLSGVAFGSSHIFWMWASFDPYGAGIGRADLNGTDPRANFIPGVWGAAGGLGGIAVTSARH